MNEIEDGRERNLSEDLGKAKAALAMRIKAADWNHDYSDDASARGKGTMEISRIYADINALAARDMSAAKEVWEANAPKEQRRPANLDRADTVAPSATEELVPEKPKSGPGSARSIRALDREMAKSHLSEGDWRGRGDLSKVMTRLEALSHVNPTKAIELWDKYRPGDPDKPIFIDNDDKDPERTRRAPQKQTPPPEKEKLNDPLSDPEEPILKALRQRYLVADDKYYKRDTARTLAFEDHGRRLTTKHDDAEIAISMVELAQIKGWDTLKVKGSEAFRREVWLKAQLQGLEVRGFKPQAVDLARLHERQADQNRPAIGTINTIEKGERIRTHAGQVRDEPDLKLTDGQQVALDAIKAIMRNRGDSEKAVAMAETVAREHFQTTRVHVGKLVDQGTSPYDNDPKNENSPYVKLKTRKGTEIIWGADLPRAIEAAGAKPGDEVTLTSPGKRAVTVKVKDRDDAGKAIGEREITTHRNGWEMRKLESLREEARDREMKLAEQSPQILRTFDPEAPRAQPRREITKLAAHVEKDRSRG